MDKKLIAAVTFGLMAVTVANLLLSAGIVSLLLSERQDTGTELSGGTNTFPGMLVTSKDSVSLEGANNTTAMAAPNVTKAAVPAANVTVTPVPAQPAGLPAGGQFTPPAGQMPPAGDQSQYAGQAPPSGEMLPAGTGPAPSGSQQLPSGTGQQPASTGQPTSGSGSAQGNMTQSLASMGYVPVDVSSLKGSQTRATPTPKPSSAFANFSSLWNQ